MRVAKLMLAAVLLCSSVAQAKLEAGTDFLPVGQPQPVDNPAAVEVLEFFWYGCPHCYHLEGKVDAWRARLPKNVVFKRVPVMWGQGHEKHAQAFYTLDALGQLDRLHGAMFQTVQNQSAELREEGAFANWAAKQQLDRNKVLATYRSFGVMSQLQRARQLGQAYGVQGVPAFYVQGKYMTSPSQVKSEDRVFQVLDELIAQEQAKLPGSKAAAPVVKTVSTVKKTVKKVETRTVTPEKK